MRKIFLGLVLVVLIGIAVVYAFSDKEASQVRPIKESKPQSSPSNAGVPLETVIAQGLDTPWSIAFLPDGGMLVTERPGRVRLIDPSGKLQDQPVANFPQVKEIGEGGLLGMVLDPDFSHNHFIYFYYTYQGSTSSQGVTLNRIVRMTYENEKLSNEKTLVDNIPGNSNHNGGRLKFGPDGYLYATTGDAENPSQAQNKNALGGKILRMTTDGKPAPGNPFGTLIYSYGHRNPQGLAWADNEKLFETEHGPSGAPFGIGHDELNNIVPGQNYGWPTIIGDKTNSGMVTPLINSEDDTWAPGDAAIIGSNVYFGGLKGQALYETSWANPKIPIEYFKNEFGRIREVITGPDGMLYITTSNNDGRGVPSVGDDKIIRINPALLK